MVSFIASSGRGDNILKADVLKKNQFPRRAKVIMWGSEMIKFISALGFFTTDREYQVLFHCVLIR